MSATLRRSALIGLPVFGQDAQPAGRVGDLLFGSAGERVIGLLLAGGTWWRRRLVPYEEVAAIGPAAVMLRQPVILATRGGSRLARLRDAHAPVLGLRVLTPGGQDLGIVEDICFHAEGGRVAGYLVSRGLAADWADGQGFLPLQRVATVRRGARAGEPASTMVIQDATDGGALILTSPV